MQFDIEFNTDHLTSVLEAVRRELATPKQMLDSLGESLLRVNRDRHNAGLAPDGTKWKPNAKSTYDAYADSLSKSSYGKDGRLNAKGATKLHIKDRSELLVTCWIALTISYRVILCGLVLMAIGKASLLSGTIMARNLI
jgi:hypothetical protein